MAENIVVAGVGMVPFQKPGRNDNYDRMGALVARSALDDCGLEYGAIQAAYAGYVYGDSCSGQAALYQVGMTGIPIVNVNNNCASGSTAFHLASQAIGHGIHDCVLAVGFEQMLPGAVDMVFPDRLSPIQRHIDAIDDLLQLDERERKFPPAVKMFGCQVDLAKQHYGIDNVVLAEIVKKARRHARHNRNAIFREALTTEEILADEPIFRGLRKLYACPPSCGAAAVIVCSESFAKRRGLDRRIRVIGQGACTDKADYFAGDPLDIMFRALSRDAARQAYERAGLGPSDIDVIELHDCFVSNEILTYSALDLCDDGDMEKFVMEGRNSYGGQVVVCPSGGLLAKGHPLGATGLAQITELVWQLRGAAGERQVAGARTALQHNGGLGSAGFVNIFQRVY